LGNYIFEQPWVSKERFDFILAVEKGRHHIPKNAPLRINVHT